MMKPGEYRWQARKQCRKQAHGVSQVSPAEILRRADQLHGGVQSVAIKKTPLVRGNYGSSKAKPVKQSMRGATSTTKSQRKGGA